jgi:hypothetical protein
MFSNFLIAQLGWLLLPVSTWPSLHSDFFSLHALATKSIGWLIHFGIAYF